MPKWKLADKTKKKMQLWSYFHSFEWGKLLTLGLTMKTTEPKPLKTTKN